MENNPLWILDSPVGYINAVLWHHRETIEEERMIPYGIDFDKLRSEWLIDRLERAFPGYKGENYAVQDEKEEEGQKDQEIK